MLAFCSDQQHGDASVTIDGAQDSEDLLHARRGETERWLVEQQELRPQHGVAHTVPAAVISILSVVGKVFDLHFFCRGNFLIVPSFDIGSENRRPSSIYKGTGTSAVQEFCS
jgi:hypothetical protein